MKKDKLEPLTIVLILQVVMAALILIFQILQVSQKLGWRP